MDKQEREPGRQDAQVSWRHTEPQERKEFIVAVIEDLAKRQAVGVERFGTEFQGDPIEHAWEELLDGLYYLWKARKERAELYGKNIV